VACLFGSVLVLDLRLLGAWRSVGLATISVPTVPLATAGFAVAVASGICLIATNGTEYVDNPFVYIKFPAIGLGVLNVIVLNRLSAWQERMTRQESARERLQLRVIGAVSLFSWLVAVAAGRMIGYW
jgi:multidrug transporter EmrE-like cation transporter